MEAACSPGAVGCSHVLLSNQLIQSGGAIVQLLSTLHCEERQEWGILASLCKLFPGLFVCCDSYLAAALINSSEKEAKLQ